MHRKSPRSLAHLGMSLGIALCLFTYGGGIALAAPQAPRSTPQYVPCSSTITKTLAQNADELTVGSSYTYAVHAYVLAKYDAHQPSLYCGPFYGEAEVVNLTTGAAPGGYLEVTFADQNSTAKTSKGTNTPGFAAFNDSFAIDSAGETWLCGNTTAKFTYDSQHSVSINSYNGCR